MSLQINNLEQLMELKKCNFNNPYTQRKFILNNIEHVKYLIENYRNNFAFGFCYLSDNYSIYKRNDEFYTRNNKKHNFEFPHCPPPVTEVYDLKSNSLEEVVDYIVRQLT